MTVRLQQTDHLAPVPDARVLSPAEFATMQTELCTLAERMAVLELDEMATTLARTRAAAPYVLTEEQWADWTARGERECLELEALVRAARGVRRELLAHRAGGSR